MQRISVASTNLASVGYESNSRTLEVQFRNGSVYQCAGVPEAVYSGLMNAASKGSYLDAFVKKAGYAVARIAGRPALTELALGQVPSRCCLGQTKTRERNSLRTWVSGSRSRL
ncbi:KTSC domain-containing protein [Streptomyces caeruleatus]|uniref:KTSC domain-containing protein n=1 Tax=Streptomyces caeruleatus TaxID=661399 RepID=UPI00099F3B5A|nr:KTSC domain-containing protein [Streptomyces caeruleatus]